MKVGLFGLGHLGKIHFKCLAQTPFECVGYFDPKVPEHQNLPKYDRPEALIDEVDAVIIAASTDAHFELAKSAITKAKHCFIEKPMTATIEEAEILQKLTNTHPELVVHIGFVERFNPAFEYLSQYIKDPRFLEIHRLAQFNERGIEVSVVFDLMIHDLDLLLNLKQSPIKEVKATGVRVLTNSLDICNARIEFEDRSVANITASRVSLKSMRKFRIFQDQGYLSMDLQKRESQIINIEDSATEDTMKFKIGDIEKHLSIKSSGALERNAILEEQLHFYNCIKNGEQSICDVNSAVKTSKIAQQIEDIALSLI